MKKLLFMMSLWTVSNCWATIHNVGFGALEFIPADITIQQGDTVRWTKPAGARHNVREVGGTPDTVFYSGPVGLPAFVYDKVFNAPLVGTYNYQCDFHFGSGMVGTVTVEAPPPPPCLDPTELVIKWEADDQVKVYWTAPQIGRYDIYGTADANLATTPPGPGWTLFAGVDVLALGQASAVLTGLVDKQFFVVIQDCTP